MILIRAILVLLLIIVLRRRFSILLPLVVPIRLVLIRGPLLLLRLHGGFPYFGHLPSDQRGRAGEREGGSPHKFSVKIRFPLHHRGETCRRRRRARERGEGHKQGAGIFPTLN